MFHTRKTHITLSVLTTVKTTVVMTVVPDVVMKIYLSVKEELLRLDDNNIGMGHPALQSSLMSYKKEF